MLTRASLSYSSQRRPSTGGRALESADENVSGSNEEQQSLSPSPPPLEHDAEALELYDQLEHEFHAMSGRPESRDRVLAKIGQLDVIYNSRVHASGNTQLLQKDAQVFSASVGAANSQNDRASSVFLRVPDANQLEDAIRRRIAEYGLDAVLSRAVTKFPGRAVVPAAISRSFGTPEARARVVREKIVREEGPAKQTVAFDHTQQNDEAQAIASIKNHLKSVYLSTGQPVPYYQFVLNRSSFTQTVENVFYLSFLVRDNYVAISRGEDPLSTTIRPLFRRADDKSQDDDDDDSSAESDTFEVEGRPDSDYLQPASGSHALFLAEMDYDLWIELRRNNLDGGIPSRRSTDESEYTRLD